MSYLGFLDGSIVENLPANAGDEADAGSIPEWGRSPGKGNGNPLQYACPRNPIQRSLVDYSPWSYKRAGHDLATEHTHRLSVQFSRSGMSNCLQPYGLQDARLSCPSLTPRACSNSSHWCHPTISSPVIPSSSHLHSFPASGSFPMSQFFASGSQSTGVSALASVLLMNIQDFFRIDWSPCSPRDSQESSPTPQFKIINSSALSFLYSLTLTSIHDYWKNHTLDYMDLCWQSSVCAF